MGLLDIPASLSILPNRHDNRLTTRYEGPAGRFRKVNTRKSEILLIASIFQADPPKLFSVNGH